MSQLAATELRGTVRPLSPGRFALVIVALSLLTIALFLLGCALGSESIDWRRALADRGSLDGKILFGLRIPRLFLAALTGAGLASAGAAYQGLLRNPLADPFILGVSGGAALGGTLVLISGAALLPALGGGAVAVGAFIGAVAATALAYTGGKRNGRLDPTRTLLVGVIFNSFAASLITVLKTMVSPTKAQELLFWLTGAIGYEAWGVLLTSAAAILVAIVVLVSQGHGLNLLALGEDGASSLGVEVSRLRAVIFLAASFIVAVAVSLTGMISFVGLLAPHLLRLALGSDHRLLLPASALAGASFLLAADVGARLLFIPLGTELPAGALTALAGGPFFLYLLRRGQVV